MNQLSYLNSENAAYISSRYEDYQKDPEKIDFGLRKFFEGFDLGLSAGQILPGEEGKTTEVSNLLLKEINVLNLINAYRSTGHLYANTNPVVVGSPREQGKELASFGLDDADLDTVFKAGSEIGPGPASLRDIRKHLEEAYCGSVGVEYKHIRDTAKIKWIEEHVELSGGNAHFSTKQKERILQKLNDAIVFENFLGTKFLGKKRFSLEGAESLIPAMDLMISRGADLGIEEYIIGMGHRGRLNVLTNIVGKPYEEVFAEFDEKSTATGGRFGGDVKYHLGYSSDVNTASGKKVHLSLCPNPSHLEAVDAVIEGITRSKIEFRYDNNYRKIAPIVLHGDASLAGQGIVYEVLQMSQLEGFKTGGTIHLVVNNQVGFTTDTKDARSSTYCTDLAKIVLSPVFRVNGDDAEAVARVLMLAIEYRQMFQEDVFVDILCYRRYGHNESDEPRFTQPLLYKAIDAHRNPLEIYIEKVVAEGSIAASYPKTLENDFKDKLQALLDLTKKEERFTRILPMFTGVWQGLVIPDEEELKSSPDTGVTKDELLAIGRAITELPDGRGFHKKIEKLFESRGNMVNKTQVFDWAMAELMAYGSLMKENFAVRLSGEDVKRGTFSHRHAVLTGQDSAQEYTLLSAIATDAKFSIYNSLLSEYAVLGFEYGYALANPNALVLWEAQFGDFANGAQIIIDQYIASAETKWRLGNGLVLLLPHGYEGQGPEHSSARIERFLELCAQNNIQVANCSTPANFFHILRRQLHRNFRRPLVVFTPKSLLRHPQCVSVLDDFTTGGFRELIDDTNVASKDVRRVLFCSGKLYYDLRQKQIAEGHTDIAIARIEQLYPTPVGQMEMIKAKYLNATEYFWVQEEPENMGPWPYLLRRLRKSELQLEVIARKESASTATGYAKLHEKEQTAILKEAFS